MLLVTAGAVVIIHRIKKSQSKSVMLVSANKTWSFSFFCGFLVVFLLYPCPPYHHPYHHCVALYCLTRNPGSLTKGVKMRSTEVS